MVAILPRGNELKKYISCGLMIMAYYFYQNNLFMIYLVPFIIVINIILW